MRLKSLADFDFGREVPRSHTPEYRAWYHLKRKSCREGIPFQRSWQESFENFKADVGDPPKPVGYQLVLRKPELGYVWSNVYWISHKRVNSHKSLVWLKYKRQIREASQLAESFGIKLDLFEKWRKRGWSVRKIEVHSKKLYEEKERKLWALRKASQAKPNPNA